MANSSKRRRCTGLLGWVKGEFVAVKTNERFTHSDSTRRVYLEFAVSPDDGAAIRILMDREELDAPLNRTLVKVPIPADVAEQIFDAVFGFRRDPEPKTDLFIVPMPEPTHLEAMAAD